MKIAVLHQSAPPPSVGNVQKPMKLGGYKDSGADIAFALHRSGQRIITPADNPEAASMEGWTFSDDANGISAAIDSGAECLWLNTVLYEGHPVIPLLGNIRAIGQPPSVAHKIDDKFLTNDRLKLAGCQVIESQLVLLNSDGTYEIKEPSDQQLPETPFVMKPVRGRGSQGVSVVKTQEELKQLFFEQYQQRGLYGTEFMVEPYLPGKECTVTVMPPGEYEFGIEMKKFNKPWCLPPVLRTNHIDGIAPYSGTVAVISNSRVMNELEQTNRAVASLLVDCRTAYQVTEARAPIRIDCRQDEQGSWFMFDTNAKPNMTGSGRPGREAQDSLVAIGAKAIGWNFIDLIVNMARQSWGNPIGR